MPVTITSEQVDTCPGNLTRPQTLTRHLQMRQDLVNGRDPQEAVFRAPLILQKRCPGPNTQDTQAAVSRQSHKNSCAWGKRRCRMPPVHPRPEWSQAPPRLVPTGRSLPRVCPEFPALSPAAECAGVCQGSRAGPLPGEEGTRGHSPTTPFGSNSEGRARGRKPILSFLSKRLCFGSGVDLWGHTILWYSSCIYGWLFGAE